MARLWTHNEDLEAFDLLRMGMSLSLVARLLNRSMHGVEKRMQRHGGINEIRFGKEATDSLSSCRTLKETATFLGITPRMVQYLCSIGVLSYYRHAYTQPKKRKKSWRYYINDDTLLQFLADHHFSFLINPDRIKEPDWSLYARMNYRDKPYWIPLRSFATAVRYHPEYIRAMIDHGFLPALYFFNRWYIWSEDVEQFLRDDHRSFNSMKQSLNAYRGRVRDHQKRFNPATIPHKALLTKA